MNIETIVQDGLTTTIMTDVIEDIKTVVYRFVNTDIDSNLFGCHEIESYQYDAITNELLSFERK